MLQVLLAQIVAEERERAVQRQLREHTTVRRPTPDGGVRQAAAGHDPASHAPDLPCRACQRAATVS